MGMISIHASRGGSDKSLDGQATLGTDFNPRFPWGKRLRLSPSTEALLKFQSTLPVGEATFDLREHQSRGFISIHASRGGSDPNGTSAEITAMVFQSTLPVGEATEHANQEYIDTDISIHASRGGSDGRRIIFLR